MLGGKVVLELRIEKVPVSLFVHFHVESSDLAKGRRLQCEVVELVCDGCKFLYFHLSNCW